MPGSLFLVATPIGNLEDITLRALRVLKDADLIAAEDTRRTGHLLAHYGIATPTTSLHEHNERSRVPALLAQVLDGRRIAIVTDAGMPSVSDPGYLIVREALRAGVQVEVIPGVSAITTALVGSGLPTDRFTFLGFAPSRVAQRKAWLTDQLGSVAGTAVLFEAPGRLTGLLEDLRAVVGDRYVVVAHELTKLHESWHRGWLSALTSPDEVGALPTRGEFVVLVSDQENPSVEESAEVDEEAVSSLFLRLSADEAISRRDALAAVAGTYGIPKRKVYAIVEKYKASGK
jgi:16S rRNA (cytidine1402-2'-O)-methyltransferase